MACGSRSKRPTAAKARGSQDSTTSLPGDQTGSGLATPRCLRQNHLVSHRTGKGRPRAAGGVAPSEGRRDRSVGRSRADALLSLLVVIWGVNFAAVQGAVADIEVLAYSALSLAVAAAVVLLVAASRETKWTMDRADWPAVVGLGLLGHALYQPLFAGGLSRTTTTHASLILALVPVAVASIEALAGIDRPTPGRWLGIGLSFAGIAAIVQGADPSGTSSWTGDAMVFGAMAAWSVYTVFGASLLARYSPLTLTAWTMVVGAVALVVVGSPQLLSQDWGAVSPRAWAMFGYATVFGLAIAYVIWYTGVQAIGGARTAVYANVVPVVALVVGNLWLGERLAAPQWLGAVAVLAGVWLARRDGLHVRRQQASSNRSRPRPEDGSTRQGDPP